MTWQTIETAPKDGTEFLAYWSGSKCFSLVGWYNDRWHETETPAEVSTPTHWMPLPEPPKSRTEARAMAAMKLTGEQT